MVVAQLLSATCLCMALPAGSATAAALSAFSVSTGTLVTPATADTWYCAQASGCNTSGTRALWAVHYPVELQTQAEALHYDVDTIYEYVRNNIETVPVYGLQKGALGAMIDRSGSPFDQAQLMVELLRLSGYTANYVTGTVQLTGDQVNAWIGTKNTAAVQAILADGGIPATIVDSAGTVGSATVAHIWVQVSIGGTNYVFDPSYKGHTYSAPINFATAMGYTEATFLSGVQGSMLTGTTSAPLDSNPAVNVNIPWVSNANVVGANGVEPAMATYSANLLTYLRTNGYADKQIDDVIGRQDIILSSGQVRQTTLPYPTAGAPQVVVQHTWTGNIPDVYRVKVRVSLLHLGTMAVMLSQDLFADEIYGRRAYYNTYVTSGGSSWSDESYQLVIDGVAVGSIYSLPNDARYRSHYVQLEIDHPYAASSGTYGDQWGTNATQKLVDLVSPVMIVLGLGETSPALQAKLGTEQAYDTLLPESTFYHCATTCEGYKDVSQPNGETGLVRSYSGWLAQFTQMATLQARMIGAVGQTHHVLGVAYRESLVAYTNIQASTADFFVMAGATVIDVDSAVSINSKSAVVADKQALGRSLASAADTLEGSIFEQTAGTASPASVAHRFQWSTTQNAADKFYLLTLGGNSTSLFPSNGAFPVYASIYSNTAKYTNANYTVITAANQDLGPGRTCSNATCSTPQDTAWMERGGAFVAVAPDGISTAHVITDGGGRDFKGGSAPSPPTFDDSAPDKAASVLKDPFKDHSHDLGVDLGTGEFSFDAPPDITVGSGSFPYKLSFQRSFRSGPNRSAGMGRGWTHNLDIKVDLHSDGMQAMGQGTPLAAASTIAALYVTQRIYATKPALASDLLKRWVIAPYVQGWWAGQIRFNAVTHSSGASSKEFVRLADGTFSPSGGYSTTDGSTYLKLAQAGSPVGYGSSKWLYSGVSFTLTSPQKDVQNFAFWSRYNHDLMQPYSHGHHKGWHLSTWVFPQGVSLSLSYSPIDAQELDDRVVSISNSVGRQINVGFGASSDYDACVFQSVDDNLGHAASYNCGTSTLTTPAGDVSKYTYATLNCDIGPWPSQDRRPWCAPALSDIYGPSDASFAKLHIAYDLNWKVLRLSDAVAVKTPAARSPYQFLIAGSRGERIDPIGNSYVVYYDKWGRATTFTNELGNTSTAHYDGLGRVKRRVTPEGISSDFSYDANSNVIQLVTTPKSTIYAVPATLTLGATYDTACGRIKTLTDARGNTTTWTVSTTTCLFSRLDQPTVLNGKTGTNAAPGTTYTYTAAGLLDTTTDPTGVAIKNSYDTSGNRTQVQIDPTGLNLSKGYGYDTVGNITSVTDERSNVTTFSYDVDRRLTRVTAPVSTCMITEAAWAGGLVTKVRKAKICNPNFATDTDWQVWPKTYTASDKIDTETDPDGGTVQTSYDGADRAEYVTQSIGGGNPARVTRTLYDAAGQVSRVYRAWGSASQILYAENGYTPDGRQDWIKDANQNLTDLDYDGYGRLAAFILPGATPGTLSPCHLTYTAGDNCELYGYDSNGNQTSKRNRSGKSLAMAYDVLNRETTRTVPANAAGNYARTLTTTYDLASRKWAATADGQTLQHSYDTAGRLSGITDSLLNTLGSGIGNVSYGYDSASNRASTTFSAAQGSWTTTYVYDAAERLATVKNGTTTFATLGYDPLSRPSTLSYLDTSSVTYTYEPDDDLQSIVHNFTGGSLSIGLTHNGAHQILAQTLSDSAYLMTQVSAQTYSTNPLNQYATIAGTALTYDLNGNLTSDGSRTMAYDEENRLRQVVKGGVTSVYAYDPLGRRRSKTVGAATTYFVNDGQNESAELSATGQRTLTYLNGVGFDARLGFSDDPALGVGGWKFYHSNHQGSILFTTRQSLSGGLGDQFSYGAFGESSAGAPPSPNPVRFTGRYFDAESGLYSYRARYYAPEVGRFLQADPIGYKDDLNLYAYVGNDPIDAVDPMGTICVWGVNASDGMCQRSARYGKLASDPRISSRTNFFSAAQIVTNALGGYFQTDFMHALSAALESANNERASEIVAGRLYQGGTIQSNTADFVHFEQSIVQQELDKLKIRNRRSYDYNVTLATESINDTSITERTDPLFARAVISVQKALGRAIDFSKQSDREALGNAIAKEASRLATPCTGTHIFKCE